jgi:hypothetical protein
VRFKSEVFQLIFLSLIGLYPLLKFDLSSKLLIVFCVLLIVDAIRNRTFLFSRKNIYSFLFTTGYFFVLIISGLYSQNKEAFFNTIIQLIPLFIIPFLLFFTGFSISTLKRNYIIKLFILVNLLYTLFISYVFLHSSDRLQFDLYHYILDYDKFQFIIKNNLPNNFFLVHKAYFSMGFAFSAIFSFHSFISNDSKNIFIQILKFLVFIYFTIWIFYAFSFPNVIALLICITLILFHNLKRKIFLIAVILLSLISVVFVTYKLNDNDVQRGFNFLKLSFSKSKYEVHEPRLEIYKSIYQIYKKSTLFDFIFGVGLGDVQDRLHEEYEERLTSEKTKNLLYYSEEFDNQYWFKNNVNIRSNSTVSISRKPNVDLMSLSNGSQHVSHNISTKFFPDNNERYTFSVFVKKGVSSHIVLRLGEIHQRAIFDLNKGLIQKKYVISSALIEPFSKNWFRCAITVNLKKQGLALIGFSNKNGSYVYEAINPQSIYLWGAQIEKGELTSYSKNNNELLQIALNESLNTHNNYLFFLLSTGCVGFFTFLIFLFYLFKRSLKPLNFLKLSFCVIIAINLLTENILSRHIGLMFVSFMLILLFNGQKNEINKFEKDI